MLNTHRQGFSPSTTISVVGESWEEIETGDWTSVGATDWTSGGTASLNGVTWTSENGARCSTFGPDGSTGIRWVQTSNSGIVANTCPAVYASLDDILNAAATDQIYVMFRISVGANAGVCGVTLRESGKYLFGGVIWVATFEVYALADSAEYTDSSQALGGTSDRVIGCLYGSGTLQVYNHGAWTGTWPTKPGGTQVGVIGEDASTAKAATLIDLTSNNLQIGFLGLRSGTNTDFTIHQHKILRRAA